MINMMRTQVFFDKEMLRKKKTTEMTWQELFEAGLEYRMWLLSIEDEDAKKLQKERKDKRLKRKTPKKQEE